MKRSLVLSCAFIFQFNCIVVMGGPGFESRNTFKPKHLHYYLLGCWTINNTRRYLCMSRIKYSILVIQVLHLFFLLFLFGQILLFYCYVSQVCTLSSPVSLIPLPWISLFLKCWSPVMV